MLLFMQKVSKWSPIHPHQSMKVISLLRRRRVLWQHKEHYQRWWKMPNLWTSLEKMEKYLLVMKNKKLHIWENQMYIIHIWQYIYDASFQYHVRGRILVNSDHLVSFLASYNSLSANLYTRISNHWISKHNYITMYYVSHSLVVYSVNSCSIAFIRLIGVVWSLLVVLIYAVW